MPGEGTPIVPPDAVDEILRAVAEGSLPPGEARDALAAGGFADLGFARLDLLRQERTGLSEVVFAEGKRAEDTVAIARRLHSASGRVLVTRAGAETASALRAWRGDARYNAAARTVAVDDAPARTAGAVLVVSAGTADLPVAEEAAETLHFCGCEVRRLCDVGIAGLHRLLASLGALRDVDALIVAAGMEGALPGVVTALTDRPVIAVPVSVGYGVARGGIAALFTMLSSCAAGMAVVNVDNGFGAAVLAHRIVRRLRAPG